MYLIKTLRPTASIIRSSLSHSIHHKQNINTPETHRNSRYLCQLAGSIIDISCTEIIIPNLSLSRRLFCLTPTTNNKKNVGGDLSDFSTERNVPNLDATQQLFKFIPVTYKKKNVGEDIRVFNRERTTLCFTPATYKKEELNSNLFSTQRPTSILNTTQKSVCLCSTLGTLPNIRATQIRSLSFTSVIYKKKKSGSKNQNHSEVQDEEIIEDEVLCDPQFEDLREQSRVKGLAGLDGKAGRGDVGVMVLQPWVKWGPKMRTNTSPQLMLQEAVALVSTLQGVSAVVQEVVNVKSVGGKTVFGKGTLERLTTQARTNNAIACVFISLDILKKMQIESLEAAFGMGVVDRYSVVLAIFHQHAHTKEARLQVALAELPYIRKRLSYERDRLLVAEREKRLRAGLTKLARVRALVRSTRTKASLPTIAVVGYTNSGKTSLIRAITQDSRAQGQDQLFATLDVTAHGTRLPCGTEAAFLDTVGFIQDIPTDLIASFRATLEDAVCADVVIHVRDVSHPEYELQGATVNSTLASLPLPTTTPIITAANKIDLGITRPSEQLDNVHLVSATTGQGIDGLIDAVQNEVLRVTGRKLWRFALPTGSSEIQWLRGVTGLAHEEVDTADPQTTHIIAVMTEQELAAFERNFGKQLKKYRNHTEG